MYSIQVDPIPKGRPRFTKIGRAYTPAATRKYEQQLRILIRQAYKEAPMDGSLSITVIFNIKRGKTITRASPCKRPDLDNYLKAFLDAANDLLYHDDGQLCEIITRKQYDCVGSIEFSIASIL